MPLRYSPTGADVPFPPSGDGTNARWIEEPTVAGDRRGDAECVSLVLVRCAPPQEFLEHAAMSDLTPPPHKALASWNAFWAGDERYMLRGQRWDGGVEWYAVTLAPTAPQPSDESAPNTESRVTSIAPRRARTALVGWRPLGSRGAARWTVAWRRA